MIRFIFYTLIFLFLTALEFSLIASLPSPWSFFPIIPTVAIWLFHQKESSIGIWYLLSWGVWQDVISTNPWLLGTMLAIVLAVFLFYGAKLLFATQSIYGLFGLGLAFSLIWIALEAIVRFFSKAALTVAFNGFTTKSVAIVVFLSFGLGMLFMFDLYFSKRMRIL